MSTRTLRSSSKSHCETCTDSTQDGPCVLHTAKILDQPVSARTLLTLPKQLEIVLTEGFGGVLAKEEIAHPTVFGPLDAPLTVASPAGTDGYRYALRTPDGSLQYHDLSLDCQCNWMKLVRLTTDKNVHSNLIAFQQRDGVYFATTKGVQLGDELIVKYGKAYGESIGKSAKVRETNLDRPKRSSSVGVRQSSKRVRGKKPVEHEVRIHVIPDKWNTGLPPADDEDSGNGGENQQVDEPDTFDVNGPPSETPPSPASFAGDTGILSFPSVDNKDGALAGILLLTNIPQADVSDKTPSVVTVPEVAAEPASLPVDVVDSESIVPAPPVLLPRKRKRTLCYVTPDATNRKRRHGRVATCEPPPQPPPKPRYFLLRENFYKYRCGRCEAKVFHSQEMLDMHSVQHGDEVKQERLSCPWCAFKAATPSQLAVHVDEHAKSVTVVGGHVCKICEQPCRSVKRLRGHIRRNHPLEWKIMEKDVTEKLLAAESKPKKPQYIRAANKSKSKKDYYECVMCLAHFPSNRARPGLKEHVETHRQNGQLPCRLCNNKKAFSTYPGLRAHMKEVHDAKNFQCDVCQKLFSLKKYLETHKVTHNGGFIFECGSCGRKFKRKFCLDNHFMGLHGEREDYMYRERSLRIAHAMASAELCQFCGRQYNGPLRLLEHQRDKHLKLLPAELRVQAALV